MNQPNEFGYRLAVEFQPMNPPRPTGVGVFKDNVIIAFLTIEQLKTSVEQYDSMVRARLTSAPPNTPTSSEESASDQPAQSQPTEPKLRP